MRPLFILALLLVPSPAALAGGPSAPLNPAIWRRTIGFPVAPPPVPVVGHSTRRKVARCLWWGGSLADLGRSAFLFTRPHPAFREGNPLLTGPGIAVSLTLGVGVGAELLHDAHPDVADYTEIGGGLARSIVALSTFFRH